MRLLRKKKEKSSSFDPFKEDLNVPSKGTTRYNKVTGEFIKTTYASTDKRTPEEEAELKRKQAILEENQKKLLKEKEEEEKRKAGIVEIIRRDRKEREEESKIQLEHRLNNPTGKIAKVEDGVVVWVDAPPIKTPKVTPTKEATLRTISDLSSDPHQHHHHGHHHHDHQPQNSDSDSDSDDDDVLLEKLPRLPKMFWNDHIFLKLFTKHGEEVSRRIMRTVGFGEAELDEIMFKGKEYLRKHKKTLPTNSSKQDNGRRLGSASPELETIPLESLISSLPEPCVQSSASMNLTVDTDSPTTTIKVRLIDGTTKEITVNHTHTISDIVEHLRSISGVSEFKLVNTSAFPRKTLTELSQTVKQANLFNTNLTQTR